ISGDSLSHTVAGEDDSDDTSADNGGSTPDTPDNGDTDTGSGSTPDTPDDGDTGADNGGSTPGTPDNGDTDTGSGSTPDTPDDGGGAGVPPGTFSLNDDVLFIGHSLVGPNMPAMLQSSVQSKGGFGDVSAQITNGGSIKANWEHSSSAQGVDARAVLPAGEIDVLVITEAVPLLSHLTWSESVEHAKRFYDLAVTSNPDTRVYVYETWHSLLSGTGQDVPFDSNGHIPWRDRLDQDLKEWESIVEYVNANKSPGQPDMHLIPAGQAMGNLYDAIQAGQVPGISSINQFFDDDIHPSDLGNYFLTMVQYATIYGQDPDDLPVQFRDEWGQNFDAPSPALADVLQDIAWETVLEYDHSGFSQGAGDADANDGGSSAPDDAPDDSGSAPDVPDTDDTGSDDGGSAPDTPDDSGMDTGNNDSAPELQGAPALGIGLNGVNDWSTQQPFLDVFKTARAWIGIRPEGGGVVEYDELTSSNYLDANGWPIEIPDGVERIRAGLLTDMPAEAESLAGRYRLSFDGEGEIQVINGQNIEYGDGEIWFDYTPTGSNNIMIDILSTASGGNHIRNISIVHEDNIAAYDAGEIFNPLWTSLIEDMRSVRFMDWMETNNSHQSEWSDRPQVEDFSWAVEGVPLEVMVELANKLGVDPWFNIPHLATQEYIEEFATYVRDNLDPNLKAHFEYSNEAWNWIFEQTFWMAEQSQARWPDQPNWVQFQAVKAVEMAQILDSVFGDQADARIIKVLPTQTDWLGLENDFLYAPNWVAENPTENLPPHTYFDVYAITGYFDGELGRDKALTVKSWIDESLTRALADAEALGLTGAAFDAYVEEHKYDYAVALSVQELRDGSVTGDPSGSLAEMFERFEYHAQVAEAHGLQMVMYEGGTHILGIGEYALDNQLTDFFTYLNYSEEMGIIYEEALAGWVDAGGTMFNAFVDVSSATQYGSWGSLRYLEDDTSRWDTLLEFNASSPVWWDDRPASAFDGTKTNYPVAVDDFVESSDNGSIVIDALSNDYDPEGSMLQISEVGTAEHGVAIAQADGTILYQPNESFTGSDRVDYWVTDEDGLTDQATIVIQLDTWDL
ncbi:Ig-like domain-containing protein, partial [Ruegeria sp. ANG-S4]|uniref:Ig-like domain-containing protein n=1 Tax=Ruegeria sp. ANG-S4 TaxID=1577904 RepID=UPI00068E3B43